MGSYNHNTGGDGMSLTADELYNMHNISTKLNVEYCVKGSILLHLVKQLRSL